LEICGIFCCILQKSCFSATPIKVVNFFANRGRGSIL
jgi:hypothetical protein